MAAAKRKLSEVLLELVEPYLPEADSDEKLEQLITTAVIAWNACLLPADERDGLVRKAGREVGGFDKESTDLFMAALRELIIRKQRLFPTDKRFVVNHRVVTIRGKHSLQVASLPDVNRDDG